MAEVKCTPRVKVAFLVFGEVLSPWPCFVCHSRVSFRERKDKSGTLTLFPPQKAKSVLFTVKPKVLHKYQ